MRATCSAPPSRPSSSAFAIPCGTADGCRRETRGVVSRYSNRNLRALAVGVTVSVLLACAAGPRPKRPAESANNGPIARAERDVAIGGRTERWRLEWRTPPVPVCEARDPAWFSCPCAGFAFGEAGDLDLARLRQGREVERLPLSPLFETDLPDVEHKAVLRRWDVQDEDLADPEADELPGRVRTRPLSTTMNLEDYDHDGVASEFVLQVATAPCGKRIGVLVGVSRRDDRLHVFRTAAHPEQPLYLRLDHWEALRRARTYIRRVDWSCGDHGSDTETEVELRADDGDIQVTEREFTCDQADQRGTLLGERRL